jgi:predicted dehydrogenase
VVLEKPMALSTDSADEVIRVSRETGKLLTVICQLRFSEDVRRLRELVRDGAFGKISLCNLSMKYYRSSEYFESSPWKGRLKFEGGGALMNQGIHGVDLIEYIVGDIKSAHGRIKSVSHNIEVEDTAVGMLEFECGALGIVEASTCAYPGFERRLEIYGDRGYAVLVEDRIKELMIDGKEREVFDFNTVKTASDPSAVESRMHGLQIKNLLLAIEGKEKLLIDCHEGKKAIRVIEDIYRTSKQL